MPDSPTRPATRPAVLRTALALAAFALVATAAPSLARGTAFPAGSLIIPMDLTHQDHGMLQAYGLVVMLVRHGVPVRWVISPKRQITDADCTVVPRVIYDDAGGRLEGTVLPAQHYRTGPFVIDAADAPRALAIIKIWNEPRRWPENPWAARSVFHPVSVHEATHGFEGPVARTLVHAPRPAILADSRSGEFARILRAAGIFQSDGAEFSEAPCLPGGCGPGTARPDFLPVEDLLGADGPCFERSGTATPWSLAGTTLFDPLRRPRYALVAAAGWTAQDRETILCEGGGSFESSQLDGYPFGTVCFDPPLTVHGHRVVNLLTAFSRLRGGLFFMGEAAFALENAVARPHAPVYDLDRLGHFFTQVPPVEPCPCSKTGTVCYPLACRDDAGVALDCCLFPTVRSRGAGILPGGGPGRPLSVLSADHPAFQLDGTFSPSTGDLGLFSPVWPDGSPIVMTPEFAIADGTTAGVLASSSVHLLADFRPSVAVPVSSSPDTQVSRLFLNALFASEWAAAYEPAGPVVETPRTCFGPLDVLTYPVLFSIRTGTHPVLEEVALEVALPDGITVQSCAPAPELSGKVLAWRAAMMTGQDTFGCVFTQREPGERRLEVRLRYQDAGVVSWRSDSFEYSMEISLDSDGDGLLDCEDPLPHTPLPCGDADGDRWDDCSGEYVDPNDGNEDCCCGDDDYHEPEDGGLVGPPCSAVAARGVRPPAGIAALLLLGLLALRRRRG